MIGYHCTTQSKLRRYKRTGCILPPVRFWIFRESARAWAKRTHRNIILRLDIDGPCYPLPDHHPRGHAWWHDGMVREWDEVKS